MSELSSKLRSFFTRIDQEKILSFTKQLYFLLGAGVPLYRAVHIIELQTTDRLLLAALQNISANLSEGKSLAECIALYPNDFSPFYASMITVGESRGELEESLKRTYEYLESRKALREKLIQALTYPAILLTSGIFVLIMMVLFVLPRFSAIFSSTNIPLPLPTKILLGVHAFITAQYLWIILGIIFLTGVVIALFRMPATRLQLDRFLLRFPVVGNLLMAVAVARLCRTLGILYNSGVQLLPALELSSVALTNHYLKHQMDSVIDSVRDGKGIARPMLDLNVFPPLMSQMIAVGEETGALEKVLLDLAFYYEQETDFTMKRIMVLIEPLALIIISIFVAVIAAAVMLPLFRMSSIIRAV
jgi:type II secretory pathway component PulF